MFKINQLVRLGIAGCKVATVGMLSISTIVYANDLQVDGDSKQKYGITFNGCISHPDEDYCSEERVVAFSKVMKERKANFAGDKLLYIYKSGYYYHMMVMDKNKKTVFPFNFTFTEADEPVNKKGELMEFIFDNNSNYFCYKGNMHSLMSTHPYIPNSKENSKFCFSYNKKKGEFNQR